MSNLNYLILKVIRLFFNVILMFTITTLIPTYLHEFNIEFFMSISAHSKVNGSS